MKRIALLSLLGFNVLFAEYSENQYDADDQYCYGYYENEYYQYEDYEEGEGECRRCRRIRIFNPCFDYSDDPTPALNRDAAWPGRREAFQDKIFR